MNPIFHITSARAAEDAEKSDQYTPEAFEKDGFIHCSYIHQLCQVADRHFKGQTDLVVLEIDPDKLDCPIKDENLEGGDELFPHVYGSLVMSAVAAIHLLPPGEDGAFELPHGLAARA